MTKPSIVLAHDWLVGLRGGEWVLDRLARLFGPTTIYTMMRDGRPLTPAIDACNVVCSPLQRLPGAAGRFRRWYLPLYQWAVERLPIEDCDLVISTSSAAIKSINVPTGAHHVCYCHSPARYIWDQTADYAFGSGGGLRSLGLRAIRSQFQRRDCSTCTRVDRMLANSAHTARKIERCYNREAQVVYPPVRTDYFTPDESVPREDFFLVVSALEPYKRVDLAIQAAQSAGIRLKVAGHGSQMRTLRSIAASGTELLGRTSDEELRDLYRRARALIYPQQEDFGIIAVEAQSCGCPVIAYAAGGALETVTAQTGTFFEQQTVESLSTAVREFGALTIDSSACRSNAERFSVDVFDSAMRAVVQDVLS